MLLSNVTGTVGHSPTLFGEEMSREEQGSVVFRVQFNAARSESQLVAYDLANKAWYQSSMKPWEAHRQLLRQFGIGEMHLALTDEAFTAGTRDAQFAAVRIPLQTLDEAGFTPKIW
jgi:hypothetical protein